MPVEQLKLPMVYIYLYEWNWQDKVRAGGLILLAKASSGSTAIEIINIFGFRV